MILKNSLFYILSIISVGLFSATLNAQEPNSRNSDKNLSSYVFHVLYLNYGNASDGKIDLGLKLKFSTEGEVFQINALQSSLTRGMNYKGPQVLTFFKEVPNGEGGLTRQPIISTNLGKPGVKIVILKRASSGQLTSSVIDIDEVQFKSDSIRILNFSDQPVKAKVGESIATLKSMSSHDFAVKAEKRNILVNIAMAGFDGEKVYIIENRRFGIRKGRRKLFILHNKASRPSKVYYTVFTIPNERKIVNFSDEDLQEIDPASIHGPKGGGYGNQ